VLATTLADMQNAAARLDRGNASLGITGMTSVDGLVTGVASGRLIIVLDSGAAGVVQAWHDTDKGVWFVVNVYAATALTWRSMLRELNNRFIALGYGATPVRWQTSGAVATYLKTLFGITAVANAVSPYFEFTPNQALGKL
jgi:hypothetical protein